METHITDITHVIQLAVAPVFLLTAIGTLITALNNRLGRVIDRRRVLQERLADGTLPAPKSTRDDATVEVRSELLLSVELARLVAVLFILAMCALIVCLGLFLREVFLAVADRALKLPA